MSLDNKKELLEAKLNQGIKNIVSEDCYKNYLSFQANFPSSSYDIGILALNEKNFDFNFPQAKAIEPEIIINNMKKVSDIPIKQASGMHGILGYYSKEESSIFYRDDITPSEQAESIIKDYVNYQLSKEPKIELDHITSSIHKESVAFIVTEKLGANPYYYSFAHVPSWIEKNDLSFIKDTFSQIQKDAKAIIDNIDKELQKTTSKAASKENLSSKIQRAASKQKDSSHKTSIGLHETSL